MTMAPLFHWMKITYRRINTSKARCIFGLVLDQFGQHLQLMINVVSKSGDPQVEENLPKKLGNTILPWEGIQLNSLVLMPQTFGGGSVDPKHRHLMTMLLSPTSKCEQLGSTGKYVLCPKFSGAIAIVPNGVIPNSHLLAESKYVYCTFDQRFMMGIEEERDERSPCQPYYRLIKHDWQSKQLLILLQAELEAGGPSGKIYRESLALALGSRFLILSTGVSTLKLPRDTSLVPGKVARIKELIESRLDGDLSLAILARESGYSRAHFARSFHATTGMTVHRYVLERRLQRAQHLLGVKDDSYSVAAVATICGFASQSHMSLAFRRQLGVTPTEFRRRL
jgi:AraC family transcriptional regulator